MLQASFETGILPRHLEEDILLFISAKLHL